MNWSDVTKYLDRTPSSVDTTVDTKQYDRRVGRAIKKINYEFTIPAYNVTLQTDYPPEIWPARIVEQNNFTMPRAFRITNWKSIAVNAQMALARLAVRYRVGDVGYRYALTPFINHFEFPDHIMDLPDPADPLPNVPTYEGQRLGANFVIELWTYRFFAGVLFVPYPIGLLNDINVITGLIRNPTGPEELEVHTDSLATVHDVADELAGPLPEQLPVAYNANGAWLTN